MPSASGRAGAGVAVVVAVDVVVVVVGLDVADGVTVPVPAAADGLAADVADVADVAAAVVGAVAAGATPVDVAGLLPAADGVTAKTLELKTGEKARARPEIPASPTNARRLNGCHGRYDKSLISPENTSWPSALDWLPSVSICAPRLPFDQPPVKHISCNAG